MAKTAFKPYACGTVLHPLIDCAIRLAGEGVVATEVEEVVCRVGESAAHQLWAPLAEKREPSTPYSARFSGPFAIALGLVERAAGLDQFAEAKVRSRPAGARRQGPLRSDPDNEYPRNYTGTSGVMLRDGTVREAHQPYLRGVACASRSGTPRSSQVSRQCRLWRLAGA